MTTHTVGEAPTRNKPKFTVAEAARAFRLARGDAAKVELIEGEKQYLRRDESGRFVLARKGKTAASGRKSPKNGRRAARAPAER
ncbi:MAG TPA: hypothetical protein VF710_18190 [Longimicrobium sp.]|jgi:hypothetical protein